MRLHHVVIAAALVGACKDKDKDKHQEAPPAAVKTQDLARVDPSSTAPLPKLAPNAPQDRPTNVGAEHDAKIAELTAEARKSWPDAKSRYLAGLPSGENLFAVAMLTSPGKRETVFIAVQKIDGTKISGAIASDIMNVTGYKVGDPYRFEEAELIDWLISKPDGSEEGNLVGKFLDTTH